MDSQQEINIPIPFPKPNAPSWVTGFTWLIRAGAILPKEKIEEALPHIRWLEKIDKNNEAIWMDDFAIETDLIKTNLELMVRQKFPFDSVSVSFDDELWIFTVKAKRISGGGAKEM